jgi:hypothetical protein
MNNEPEFDQSLANMLLAVGLEWIYGSVTIKYRLGIAMVMEQSGAVMIILFFMCSKSNSNLLQFIPIRLRVR